MRLFVPLSRGEAEALTALARAERRRPQDHAAVLLAAAIAAAGEDRCAGNHGSDPALVGRIGEAKDDATAGDR